MKNQDATTGLSLSTILINRHFYLRVEPSFTPSLPLHSGHGAHVHHRGDVGGLDAVRGVLLGYARRAPDSFHFPLPWPSGGKVPSGGKGLAQPEMKGADKCVNRRTYKDAPAGNPGHS